MTGKTKELAISGRSVAYLLELTIIFKKVYDFVPNFVPLHGYQEDEIRNVCSRKKFVIESSGDNEDRDMACFICDERFSNSVRCNTRASDVAIFCAHLYHKLKNLYVIFV